MTKRFRAFCKPRPRHIGRPVRRPWPSGRSAAARGDVCDHSRASRVKVAAAGAVPGFAPGLTVRRGPGPSTGSRARPPGQRRRCAGRLSAGLRAIRSRACSGAMKAKVPPSGSLRSSDQAVRSRAMPKSISRGSPASSTRMFFGLMSRWMIPAGAQTPPRRPLWPAAPRPGGLEPTLRGELIEVPAADVFHHQVGPIIVKVEVVDPDQVGMLQLGQDLPLLDDLATGRRARPAAWRA